MLSHKFAEKCWSAVVKKSSMADKYGIRNINENVLKDRKNDAIFKTSNN